MLELCLKRFVSFTLILENPEVGFKTQIWTCTHVIFKSQTNLQWLQLHNTTSYRSSTGEHLVRSQRVPCDSKMPAT